jgi:glutamate racemase
LQAASQKAQQEREKIAQKQQQAQNTTAQTEATKSSSKHLPDQVFDQQAAQAAWVAYLNQNNQQSWIFGAFFKRFKVRLENQTDLILLTETDNPALREEFEQQVRERFAIFVRDRLQNQQIQVFLKAENEQTQAQTSDKKAAESKKVFTNEEKFNYLEQYYPQLSEFKKKFNLDIE